MVNAKTETKAKESENDRLQCLNDTAALPRAPLKKVRNL